MAEGIFAACDFPILGYLLDGWVPADGMFDDKRIEGRPRTTQVSLFVPQLGMLSSVSLASFSSR